MYLAFLQSLCIAFQILLMMDKSNASDEYSTSNESFVTIEEQEIKVRVGFLIQSPIITVGEIVEVEFIIENHGNKTIYSRVGGSSSVKRPAYFSFDVIVKNKDIRLKDPMKNVTDIGGPFGTIKVPSGDSFSQILILNEYIKLEDLVNCMEKMEKDTLQINCFHHLIIGQSENDIYTNTDALIQDIDLELVLPVRRID